jgi:hypothetical protein
VVRVAPPAWRTAQIRKLSPNSVNAKPPAKLAGEDRAQIKIASSSGIGV